MRRAQSTLSYRDVCALAVHTLTQALGWAAGTAAVAPALLVQLLVRAAAELRSLSAIALEAAAAPSPETVRLSLLRYLPGGPDALLPALVEALHHRLPRGLARRRRTLAADLHLKPYYGDRARPGVYLGKPKAGTKAFFAYATLMVLRRGQAFTVGLAPVAAGDELPDVLGQLLAQAAAAGLRPKQLLLDRGFYAAPVIAGLQKRGLAFVMPMIRRGKKAQGDFPGTGTQPFFQPGRYGWAQHTWTARPKRGGRRGPALTVTVDVCMAPDRKGRKGRKRRRPTGRPLVYVCHGVQRTPAGVRELYRRRFAIEASYRQLREGLARTSTRQAAVRLLLVGIALVLRNLWVWLHWTKLGTGDVRRRRRRLGRLRLRRLTRWLIRALDEVLGVRAEVVVIDADLGTA
jgi:Transposase DDE domain